MAEPSILGIAWRNAWKERGTTVEILELAELVRELKRRDPKRRVFGAEWGSSGHRYAFNPRLEVSKINHFEQCHGIVLPEDYREFLLRVGDGGAGPNYGVKCLQDAAKYSDLTTAFPWTEETELETEAEWDLWDAQPGILWISDRGCGYTDFLVVVGEQRGLVWNDFTAAGCPLVPTSLTFSQWYRDWVIRCLTTLKREPLLDRITVGMPLDDVRAILGDQIRTWEGSAADSDDYYVGFANTNASFKMTADGRVKEVNRFRPA